MDARRLWWRCSAGKIGTGCQLRRSTCVPKLIAHPRAKGLSNLVTNVHPRRRDIIHFKKEEDFLSVN